MTDNPTPGSPEAVAQGCTCSPEDNNYGRGAVSVADPYPGTVWIIWYDCPVHRPPDYDHGEKDWNDVAE